MVTLKIDVMFLVRVGERMQAAGAKKKRWEWTCLGIQEDTDLTRKNGSLGAHYRK